MKADQKAWPSPRSWEMASNLFKCNLPIDIAIGEGTASEFKSFINVYKKIPNLENILKGKGKDINFPKQNPMSISKKSPTINSSNKFPI